MHYFQGLWTFHKWLALQVKIEQARHEMKRIARLFLSFITQPEIILATTLRDQRVFWHFVVTNYSFRMTKFRISRLESPIKHTQSQTQTNCPQTLGFILNIYVNKYAFLCIKVEVICSFNKQTIIFICLSYAQFSSSNQ